MLLQVLELHFAQEVKTWKNTVKKSIRWMKNVLAKANPRIYGEDMMVWVEDFVQESVRVNS